MEKAKILTEGEEVFSTKLYFISGIFDYEDNADWFIEARDEHEAVALWKHAVKETFGEEAEMRSVYLVPGRVGHPRVLPWHEEDGLKALDLK